MFDVSAGAEVIKGNGGFDAWAPPPPPWSVFLTLPGLEPGPAIKNVHLVEGGSHFLQGTRCSTSNFSTGAPGHKILRSSICLTLQMKPLRPGLLNDLPKATSQLGAGHTPGPVAHTM